MGFSKLEAIKRGIEKTREDSFVIIGISAVAVIYWTIPFYIASYLLAVHEGLGTILLFFILILNFLILMGYIKAAVDFYDGNSVSLRDLFFHYKKLPDFLIGFLFYAAVVAAGSLLLVIPGIYFAVRFSFAFFLILQGKASALESLKNSWKITKGEFFNLLFLFLFIILINTIGATIMFVGLFFTLPVSAIAVVHAFRSLAYDKKKKEIEKIS